MKIQEKLIKIHKNTYKYIYKHIKSINIYKNTYKYIKKTLYIFSVS